MSAFAGAADSRPPPADSGAAGPGEGRDRGAPHTWTGEQDRSLLAMHAGGMGAAEIAAVVDIDQAQIQQRLLWLTLPKANTGRAA